MLPAPTLPFQPEAHGREPEASTAGQGGRPEGRWGRVRCGEKWVLFAQGVALAQAGEETWFQVWTPPRWGFHYSAGDQRAGRDGAVHGAVPRSGNRPQGPKEMVLGQVPGGRKPVRGLVLCPSIALALTQASALTVVRQAWTRSQYRLQGAPLPLVRDGGVSSMAHTSPPCPS